MSASGFMIYLEDLEEILDELTDEQLGAMIRALARHVKTGEDEKPADPTVRLGYKMCRAKIDRDLEKLAKRSAQNKANIEKRWSATSPAPAAPPPDEERGADPRDAAGPAIILEPLLPYEAYETVRPYTTVYEPVQTAGNCNCNSNRICKSKSIESVSDARAREAAPSLPDVQEYVKAKGYKMDAGRFFAKNAATGWQVHGDPIRDWRAACDAWESLESRMRPEPSAPRGPKRVTEQAYDQRPIVHPAEDAVPDWILEHRAELAAIAGGATA